MPLGDHLRRAACALGFHLVDPDDLRRRKLRAARMGIDLRGGLPCACQRCGAGFRTADVSHMRWDRGHSFTHLVITMRDGSDYCVKDWNGSAYAAEQAILAGVAADERRMAP